MTTRHRNDDHTRTTSRPAPPPYPASRSPRRSGARGRSAAPAISRLRATRPAGRTPVATSRSHSSSSSAASAAAPRAPSAGRHPPRPTPAADAPDSPPRRPSTVPGTRRSPAPAAAATAHAEPEPAPATSPPGVDARLAGIHFQQHLTHAQGRPLSMADDDLAPGHERQASPEKHARATEVPGAAAARAPPHPAPRPASVRIVASPRSPPAAAA